MAAAVVVALVLGYLLALAAESHAAADLPFPFVAVLEWSVTGVLVVVTGGYWFERGTGHALAVNVNGLKNAYGLSNSNKHQ